MRIPTEPIGSIPRTLETRDGADPALEPLYEEAVRDTIARFEATRSPFVAVKLDPSGELVQSFVHLNNLALSRFSGEDRTRLGVHTCPGGDLDSTHSADVDYCELLPSLFQLRADNFHVALASEKDRACVLKIIRSLLKPQHRVFVAVVAPIDPRVEAPEEVRDHVLEAAKYIPPEQLGTTDDCGFAPFRDDRSTSRDTAFAKNRARVEGTALAERVLGGS